MTDGKLAEAGWWIAWGMVVPGLFLLGVVLVVMYMPKYRARMNRLTCWAGLALIASLLPGPVIRLLGLHESDWLDLPVLIVQITLLITGLALLVRAYQLRKQQNTA